jgi:phosphonoacetaldehyde hydrolase
MLQQHGYHGPIKAVITGWTGLLIDYGVQAPVKAIQEIFKKHDLNIDTDTCLSAIGLERKAHIAALLERPNIAHEWYKFHGRLPDKSDLEALYTDYLPIEAKFTAAHCELIEGVTQAVHYLRTQNIKLGTYTSYHHDTLKIIETNAKKQGLITDTNLCIDDIVKGSPYPYALQKVQQALNVESVHACVRVSDKVPGIIQGFNAGMVTIGVILSGAAMGMTKQSWHGLSAKQQKNAKREATETFMDNGAQIVIDSFAELPQAIERINEARQHAAEATRFSEINTHEVGLGSMKNVPQLRGLFEKYGMQSYGACYSQQTHMLNAAFNAEQQNAKPSIILAALLHNIGLFLSDADANALPTQNPYSDSLASQFVRTYYNDEVVGIIANYVAAKRYLSAIDKSYQKTLSDLSQHLLPLQGGPMSELERKSFEANPYFQDAIILSSIVEQQMQSETELPALDYFDPYLGAPELRR